jgi:hypothetical protein
MKPSEIIKKDSEKRGLDPTKTLVSIQYILTHKLGFLLNKNNSVLLLAKIGNNEYETHLFTEDSPLKLGQAMIAMFHDIEGLKIKAIYGNADNPQIINLLKQLAEREGTEIQNPDKPNYNWMIRL